MNHFLPAASASRRRLRSHAVALAAGAMLVLGSAAANAQTQFTGSTLGCFAVSAAATCTNFSAGSSVGGLTYTNSTFDVTSAGGGVGIGSAPSSPNTNNLGSFALSSTPFTYDGQHFDLQVTFTLPSGTTPSNVAVNDVITGTVSSNGSGGISRIDFDNSLKHFASDNGSFDFFVNDLSITGGGDTVAVTGGITNVSAVPEPETYALFMAGLGAIGFMARRRRKS